MNINKNVCVVKPRLRAPGCITAKWYNYSITWHTRTPERLEFLWEVWRGRVCVKTLNPVQSRAVQHCKLWCQSDLKYIQSYRNTFTASKKVFRFVCMKWSCCHSSLPTHIAVCGVFISNCKITPHHAPPPLCHQDHSLNSTGVCLALLNHVTEQKQNTVG